MSEQKKSKNKKYYKNYSNHKNNNNNHTNSKNNKNSNPDNNNPNSKNNNTTDVNNNYIRKEKYYKGSKNKSGYYKKDYKKDYKKNYSEKTAEEYENIYIEKKKKDGQEKPICPICNEPIYIIEQSILYVATNTPAHFDCIIKHLSEENKLEENEKIVYLGSGTFGIIQERNAAHSSGSKFFVKKRIDYEDRKVNKKDDIDLEEEELFNV